MKKVGRILLLFMLFHGASGSLYCQLQYKSPKNIILMIGDGMGYSQVIAGTYYQYGDLSKQQFLKFPVQSAMATYPAKAGKSGEDAGLDWSHGYNTFDAWSSYTWISSEYTCSAASGTAIASGIKTYNGGLGVGVDGKPLENISQVAKSLGKAAGVITSVQISHATPASFVAHNKHRNNYSQIAREIILDSKIDVVMGAGHPYYDHDGKKLHKAKSFKYVGDSLIWHHVQNNAITYNLKDGEYSVKDSDGDGKPNPWTFIENKEDFENIADGKNVPKRLLAVAKVAETLQQRRKTTDDASYFEGDSQAMEDAFVIPFIATVPDLPTMSLAALNVLEQNNNGFFLMIEGGAIDWACHGNQKGRTIEEFIDFTKSVDAVVQWVENNSSWDETLLIVTADHETGYLTGLDEIKNKPFANPIINKGKGNMPLMQFNSNSHTNSLVPVYAKGAGSELILILADEIDQVYGPYIQNSELGAAMKILWNIR